MFKRTKEIVTEVFFVLVFMFGKIEIAAFSLFIAGDRGAVNWALRFTLLSVVYVMLAALMIFLILFSTKSIWKPLSKCKKMQESGFWDLSNGGCWS